MSVVPRLYDGSGLPPNTTMVAVDKDKNSSYAFRWALNHLDNPLVIAVHVKQKTDVCNCRYPLIFHDIYLFHLDKCFGNTIFCNTSVGNPILMLFLSLSLRATFMIK